MLLLNPKHFNDPFPDEKTNQIFRKTIEFFEDKGLESIKEDDQDMVFCDDWIRYNQEIGAYATLLTPAGYGDADSRLDMNRMAQFNEILAFYGLSFQYNYQVSILGLGPIWMGDNEEVKHRTAQMLKDGGIFAFGLSEKNSMGPIFTPMK